MIGRLTTTALTATALVLGGAAVAAALTVDEAKIAQSGQRFDVRCGEPQTVTWTLPQGAERVEVLEPVAGQAVMDGFGDKRLATVQDVALRPDAGGRPVVDITVVGGGAACDGLGLSWQTDSVEFHARYHDTHSSADRPEALREMMRAYVDHMHSNQPVHTWPTSG